MENCKNNQGVLDKQIDCLNQIIIQSIYYGGDSGGPYFMKSEIFDLIHYINQFLIETKLNEDYVVGLCRFNYQGGFYVLTDKFVMTEGSIKELLNISPFGNVFPLIVHKDKNIGDYI